MGAGQGGCEGSVLACLSSTSLRPAGGPRVLSTDFGSVTGGSNPPAPASDFEYKWVGAAIRTEPNVAGLLFLRLYFIGPEIGSWRPSRSLSLARGRPPEGGDQRAPLGAAVRFGMLGEPVEPAHRTATEHGAPGCAHERAIAVRATMRCEGEVCAVLRGPDSPGVGGPALHLGGHGSIVHPFATLRWSLC